MANKGVLIRQKQNVGHEDVENNKKKKGGVATNPFNEVLEDVVVGKIAFSVRKDCASLGLFPFLLYPFPFFPFFFLLSS